LRWPAALIVLGSFALRVYRLGDANVWWDEALAIWAVRKGLGGVTAWTASDVHPPLYFWSLWGWVQLFGEGELAARLLSAVLGVLTVIIVYRLGRRLRGERVGLLAAFLTGFSRFHIWWSQELRMYVLAGLLGTLSLYHLLGWLHERVVVASRWHCALWAWVALHRADHGGARPGRERRCTCSRPLEKRTPESCPGEMGRCASGCHGGPSCMAGV